MAMQLRLEGGSEPFISPRTIIAPHRFTPIVISASPPHCARSPQARAL